MFSAPLAEDGKGTSLQGILIREGLGFPREGLEDADDSRGDSESMAARGSF